jgi:hypothetical protein
MRNKPASRWAVAAAVLVACACAPRQALGPATITTSPLLPATAREGQALRKFQKEAAEYVALREHARAKRAMPAADASAETVAAFSTALARDVQKARGTPRQGEVFRHAIRPLFVRTLAEQLDDPATPGTRHAVGDGNPRKAAGVRGDADIAVRDVRLRVNAVYPTGVSLSTMPPTLLQRLPSLPGALEYRFVGRDLLILDPEVHMVVDVLPNALPLPRTP